MFEEMELDVPCPHCGKTSKQRVSGTRKKKVTCPKCRKTFDTDARDVKKKGDKVIDDFLRKFK